MFKIYLEYAWEMSDICLRYAFNMSGLCVKFEICLIYIWETSDIYSCDKPEICIRYTSEMQKDVIEMYLRYTIGTGCLRMNATEVFCSNFS